MAAPTPPKSTFSAAEPGLGYIFQARFALLKTLDLPEDDSIYIERNDDVEFVSADGGTSLASLKHKAEGDRLTDLSVDFWKSVRVWLDNYKSTGKLGSNAQFLLFTTATVVDDSFLRMFVEPSDATDDEKRDAAALALASSTSVTISKVRAELQALTADEARDFYGRVTIFSNTERIDEVPKLVDKRLRTVRREHRQILFERLEGWWIDLVIKLLTGQREGPIKVQEVSDKLASLADEYKTDNLPITFRTSQPEEASDSRNDNRRFVQQLRALKLSEERIRIAITDYYRAFSQRSAWARENLLVSGEIDEYESRLVDEWARYKGIVCENITDSSTEEVCVAAGREIYKWAELHTGHLRIRERVTEPFVVRGTFHLLANADPSPRVHWHPYFMQRVAALLGLAA